MDDEARPNTVVGPTRRQGNVSRRRSVTTKPRTESPRCSKLRSNVSEARDWSGPREPSRSNNTYISLSWLGSSVGCTNHALSVKTRGPCGSIYITSVPTWVIFEETVLLSEETAVGEYLEPDTVLFDDR